LIFSVFKISKPSFFLLKLILLFSIIYSFSLIFAYVNIILTSQEFYIKFPFETILLLIGSSLMILGNSLIFLFNKSGFWLSLIGTIIVFFVNSSFQGIGFFQKLYGIEFQLLIFLIMKLKIKGICSWDFIYNTVEKK
tara:strand:+ start:339 stop:749 length:411 start_codon:yes stop_codon:yes gene_type:complete